jgi:hypothetical protein
VNKPSESDEGQLSGIGGIKSVVNQSNTPRGTRSFHNHAPHRSSIVQLIQFLIDVFVIIACFLKLLCFEFQFVGLPRQKKNNSIVAALKTIIVM